MRKKNNDHSKPCPISSCAKGVIIVLMSIVLVVSSIAAIVISSTANSKVKELEHQISQITTQQQAGMDSPTEQTVAFLESELQRHREFIQDQENHLIWLVSAVGALAIFLLSITGLSNRREIKNTIEENYKQEVNWQIDKMIGGENNRIYLENAVQNEKDAKQKKVLFVYESDNEENAKDRYSKKILEYTQDELEDLEFNVSRKIKGHDFTKENLEKIIKKYDVIVYEVGAEEDNDKKGTPLYVSFFEACDQFHKYGVMYYDKGRLTNFDTKARLYTSTVNMRLTLRQQIFSILYH